MKKRNLLLLSTSIFMICGCSGGSSSSKPSSTSSELLSSSEISSISSIESISSSASSSATSSMNQSTALGLFKEALKKDYSNVTISSVQYYDYGETSETDIEYVNNGYIVDFSQDLFESGYDQEDCMSYYYIDTDGTCYTYFEPDSSVENSRGGWLNKGYKNADLSIWNAYFYLPLLLNNISEDDVIYNNGMYYVHNSQKIEELQNEAFRYYYGDPIVDIVFYLTDGYISRIYGFIDSSTDPTDYVEINLYNIGNTSMPSCFSSIPEFSEETKTTYWQYKGWPQDYQNAYYEEIHVSLGANQDLVSDETHDVILELDESFNVDISLSPESFNPWDIVEEDNKTITWHYNSSILELNHSYSSTTKTFRAIGAGETEVYASVNVANSKTIESEHIKVKVNEAPQQDKVNAVYDFSWASIEADNTLTASNNVVDSHAPYSITAGPGSLLLDGRYCDLFEDGKQCLVIQPLSSETMNKDVAPGLYFDFDDQQVSKISFKYASFYANQLSNLNHVTGIKLKTSNDGSTWNELDITEEIKNNISENFTKLFEAEFAPASKIQIVFERSFIGGNLSVCLDSMVFNANENCHNHVSPEDVHVESVTISGSDTLYVGDSVTLTGVVLPNDAFDKSLTWHVEEGKENVVSIENGVVTGLSAGSAKVWAISNDGNVVSNEMTITVNEKPSFAQYVNNVYKEENNDYLLTILSSDSAKFEFNNKSITATIKSVNADEEFILENDNGEGFKISFANNRADVSQIKYLDSSSNLITISATYYCYKQIFMDSFTIKVGSLTANSEGKYEVFKDATVYLSILNTTPSNANVKDITYTSSDTSIATVEYYSDTYELVSFVGVGEVTITATDTHNPSIKQEITFVVSDLIYPTDSTWSLSVDKETITVGQIATFTTTFDSSINSDKTVTYSVNDSSIATISRSGVLTGKSEGTVIVSASVNTKTGVSIKTKSITVEASQEGTLDAIVVGSWSGQEMVGENFYVEVNADGTAILSNDYGETYNFTFDRLENSEYYFTYDEDNTVEFGIWFSGSNASFTLYDENWVIDGANLYFMDQSYEITK